MSTRIMRPRAEVDRPVLAVVVLTAVLTAAGLLWLVPAGMGERLSYRTVRVDSRAAVPLQLDAVDAGGDRLGLGEAGPRATTTFDEVVDPGGPWTLVAGYGGREVWRQAVTGPGPPGADLTVQIPAEATADLERQGFR
jgi:hypothetical protein